MIITGSNSTVMFMNIPTDCPFHKVTMALNCETHDYAHTVGYACWNCGRQYFHRSPFGDAPHKWLDLHEQEYVAL